MHNKALCFFLFCIFLPITAYSTPFFNTFIPESAYNNEQAEQSSSSAKHTVWSIRTLPEMNGRDTSLCISDFSILRRQEVRKSIAFYLSDGREEAVRGFYQADFYKTEIDSVLISFPSVPKEIAALPILESGYSPFAVSRMKAVGAWQIIAPTALSLGLTVNSWIDERRDVRKSTVAALQHLSFLYNCYGQWDFALAAYNGGTPCISKAIRKHQTLDYWTLVEKSAFRPETNNYVPQFSALAIIYFNRELFGIEKYRIKAQEYEEIGLAYPVRIDDLARISGTTTEIVQKLNPEIAGIITPPGKGRYLVRLPPGSADRIMGREDRLYHVKFSSIARHKVKKGESVQKIAKIYGIDPSAIIYINGMERPYYLKAGKEIFIPKL